MGSTVISHNSSGIEKGVSIPVYTEGWTLKTLIVQQPPHKYSEDRKTVEEHNLLVHVEVST